MICPTLVFKLKQKIYSWANNFVNVKAGQGRIQWSTWFGCLIQGMPRNPVIKISLKHPALAFSHWEQHRNMYTIKGETDYRPRLDAWDKRSDLVLWEDLERAGGEGGGRGDRDGEDMWTQGLFISMYDKIHYKLKKKNTIAKKKKKKKRKKKTSNTLIRYF